jgi:glutathione S-transferase
MADLTLVIGNRNYSSWSLRPWLLMRHAGLEFREVRIPLDRSDTRARIREQSPAGLVPVLRHGTLRIWDSLAICEYVSENLWAGRGWPRDARARAEARSVACEMHAGFAAMRSELPMNCRARNRQVELSEAAQAEVARICEVLEGSRRRYGHDGRWLFGDFGIADAMYAPVALRFLTYGIDAPPQASTWCARIADHPALKEWCKAAAGESEVLEREERGLAVTAETAVEPGEGS